MKKRILTSEEYGKTLHPDAEKVGTFSYMIKGKKLDLLRALLSTLRDHPLFVLAIGAFIAAPSISSFLIVVIAVLVNQMINNALGHLELAKNQRVVLEENIYDFFKKYKTYEVAKVAPSDYLIKNEYNAYEDIDKFLVKAMLKLIFSKKIVDSNSLDGLVTIYVLDTDEAIFGNVAAFAAPMRSSYIVFDHKPEDCGPFQNFALLHELGHTLTGLGKAPFFSKYGFSVLLFSLIGAIIIFDFTSSIGWLFLATYLLSIPEIYHDILYEDLKEETASDFLAVGYMNPTEVKQLAETEDSINRFIDERLLEKHNAIRIAKLNKMLQLQAAGKTEELDNLFYSDPLQTKKPSFFKLVLIISSYLYLGANLTLGSYALGKSLLVLMIVTVAFFAAFLYSSIKAKQIEAFILSRANQ